MFCEYFCNGPRLYIWIVTPFSYCCTQEATTADDLFGLFSVGSDNIKIPCNVRCIITNITFSHTIILSDSIFKLGVSTCYVWTGPGCIIINLSTLTNNFNSSKTSADICQPWRHILVEAQPASNLLNTHQQFILFWKIRFLQVLISSIAIHTKCYFNFLTKILLFFMVVDIKCRNIGSDVLGLGSPTFCSVAINCGTT